MFAPPPIIETTVFARLPERFRRRGESAPWLHLQRRGAEMDSFLEGPCFDLEGNLYVVDIPYGRVFCISPNGAFTLVVEYDGEPNGLKRHVDGRFFIADHRNGLMALDVADGRIEALLQGDGSRPFKGLNDLTFAQNGDLYFTDQGQTGLQDPTGRLFRLTSSGGLSCLLDTAPSPNGVVMDRDQGSLLLAVTRANSVWRVPLLLDGRASKVGVFVQLSGGIGPDGLALDPEGNLAVCHPGLGAVWLFRPTGEPLYRVRSCRGRLVTNCAFGGSDGRSLFITESETGTILRAEIPASEEEVPSEP